jgi:hypothetical protein
MEREDWQELKHYLKVAVEAQREVRKVLEAGKEQISARSKAIEQFARLEAQPELFMRLGEFVGARYPED